MEKRIIQLIALVLGVFVIWTIWHPLWRYDLNEAVDPGNTVDIIFDIDKGSAAKTIAKNLEAEDLIVNDRSFLRTVEEEELTQSLRYGRFILSQDMTMREIITVLTTAGTGEMAITVIEGWTVDNIDEKLTDLGLITEGDLRKCTFNCTFEYDFLTDSFGLEGFLFPDTYFIDSATFSVEGFIDQMLTNFDNKFTDDMATATEEAGRTIQEVVNLASMLEKEVRTTNDIPIVADIIWRRLDNDWMLGIDATLLYILDTEGQTTADGSGLTSEDLQTDSPYNTRIYTGLPPSPISNPGLASLEGAVYPEATDYWFYLTTLDTGEVIYSKTNEEHEENKAIYLQ
jgi:UPF0755 protein